MVAPLGQLQVLQTAADVCRFLLQPLIGPFQLLLTLQDGAQLLLDLILLTSEKHGHINNRLNYVFQTVSVTGKMSWGQITPVHMMDRLT